MVYLAIVVKKPTVKEQQDGAVEELITEEPILVVAKDDEKAKFKAVQKCGKEWDDKWEVLLVPFRS